MTDSPQIPITVEDELILQAKAEITDSQKEDFKKAVKCYQFSIMRQKELISTAQKKIAEYEKKISELKIEDFKGDADHF